MLPYFEQPVLRLGPLSVHAFGAAVAAALWLGLSMGQRRFERQGLDPATGSRLGGWVIVAGIIGAHLFSVLLYFPEKLRDDPWLLLRVWEDISSFGAILGGVAGALLFFALRATPDERRRTLDYLDVVAFVFPFSLAVGRVGCALAHDHPGTVTSFPLAFSLASDRALAYIAGVYAEAGRALPAGATAMGFHDLGLYEMLYLAVVILPLFALWSRRARPAGFWLFAFAALYFPVRFGLDLLRVSDARYAGLTPAQWVAALVVAALPVVALRHRRARLTMGGAVILAAAWACSGGGL